MSTAQQPAALTQLRLYLQTQPAGALENTATVKRLLAEAWDHLDTSRNGDSGMRPDNLRRVQDITWQPPKHLRFRVERRGVEADGSRYAETQFWSVEIKSGFTYFGTRKRYPTPRLNTGALAAELADLIIGLQQDERLRWSSDGRVQVRMSVALAHAVKQTTEGRRQRLNQSLGIHLGAHGWERQPGGWWAPAAVVRR